MAYDYCSTGDHRDDEDTRELLANVISIAKVVGRFDEKQLFRGDDADVCSPFSSSQDATYPFSTRP